MKGNGQMMQVARVDQLLLVAYISIHPDTTLDEMAAFIYNEGGSLYSNEGLFKPIEGIGE
jgi:hypothetical protein